jgi:hypothetical protein
MASGLTEPSILETLVAQFEEAESSTQEAHLLAKRSRDYYDGKQLTDAEVEALRKRGQPPIVINRIRRKIDWLRGLEAQSRTDPRAFPRTPKHQQGADAATDAIMFVCDAEQFHRKKAAVWANMLIEGYGGVEVVHEPEPDGGARVKINFYSWDRLFHDPHSMEADFSDARYLGAVVWSDADALIKQYPDAEDAINASIGYGGANFSDTYEDKPYWQVWSDPRRKRVRCVLQWYRDGDVWKFAKYVRGGIIEEGDSPYMNERGESVCPLIMQSAYVDRQGNRYGVVRDMLDPQDEINKRRSKLLHQLNSRQTVGIKGAVSVQALKAAIARPDGHVEIDPAIADAAREMGMRPFDVLPNADQTAGQFSLLQEAKAEIDLMGANSGLAGKESDNQSGRAIIARQQGGLIEIAPLSDGLSDFTNRVYREIWNRIRQFWRAEKWVRVTDDERNVRFVGLNRRVTLAEYLGQLPEEQVQAIARQLALVPNDPRLSEVVSVENPVEEIDIDITIDEVPTTVTLESETFQQVVSLATAMPGSVPPEILIELAPGIKRDVKDRLLELLEQQKQAQTQGAQAQMAEQQTRAMIAQSGIAKTEADAQRSLALAQKTAVEAQRLALGY